MRSLALSLLVVCTACHKPHPTSFGAKGQPFGLVSGVALGMSVDDVKRVAPEMHPQDDSKPPNDIYMGYREPSENYHLHFHDGRVRSISIDLAKRSLDDLTAAWGPPTKELAIERGSGERDLLYIDAAHGMRAKVEVRDSGLELWFGPYVPFATLVDGPDPYSLLGTPVLGKPLTEVVTALLAKNGVFVTDPPSKQRASVRAPATELGDDIATTVVLSADPDGNVARWELDGLVPTSTREELRAEIRAALEHKWGPPILRKGDIAVYGTPPRVRVDDKTMQVTVSATDLAP